MTPSNAVCNGHRARPRLSRARPVLGTLSAIVLVVACVGDRPKFGEPGDTDSSATDADNPSVTTDSSATDSVADSESTTDKDELTDTGLAETETDSQETDAVEETDGNASTDASDETDKDMSGQTNVDPEPDPAPEPDPECGDGTRDADEECDDGNDHDNDGCASCSISDGWVCVGDVGEPSDCSDVDECEENTHDCDQNAACTNIDGSFTCTCKDGFTGTGQVCTPASDCASGTLSCGANATCEGPAGSSSCVCNDGFIGDAEAGCTDQLECDSNSLNDCDSDADCIEEVGSYSCECHDGYQGDGFDCDNVDECTTEQHDCGANTACEDTEGSFTCECLDGYDPLPGGKSCGCAQKSSTNLVGPAGFDSPSNVNGSSSGSGNSTTTWTKYDDTDPYTIQIVHSAAVDANECPGSGSMQFKMCYAGIPDNPNTDNSKCSLPIATTVCVDVEPNTSYVYGYRYKREAGGYLSCFVLGFPQDGCQGATNGYVANSVATGNTTQADTQFEDTTPHEFTTPATVESLQLGCRANSNQTSLNPINIWMDEIYISPVGSPGF